MAVLTEGQHVRVQQAIAHRLRMDADKPMLKLALQAVEDKFEAEFRSAVNTAINNATSPIVLSAQTKKLLVAYYLFEKFNLEAL